jgi:hypothetical protein
MKNAIVWDVKSSGSCYNRGFGGNVFSIFWIEEIIEQGRTLTATNKLLLTFLAR